MRRSLLVIFYFKEKFCVSHASAVVSKTRNGVTGNDVTA